MNLPDGNPPGGDGGEGGPPGHSCQRQSLEDRRERVMDMLAAGVVVASAFTAFMVSSVLVVATVLFVLADSYLQAAIKGADAMLPTVGTMGPIT